LHVDDNGKGLRVTSCAGTQGGYILNLGPDWEWVINAEPLPLYPREGTTVAVEGGPDGIGIPGRVRRR